MILSRKTDELGKKAHTIRMPAKFADMTEEERECDGGSLWAAVGRHLGRICGAGYVFSLCMMIFDEEHRDAWAITAVATGIAAVGLIGGTKGLTNRAVEKQNFLVGKGTTLGQSEEILMYK